ncbi:MAG: hypothetical protein A3B99_02165 [Candidatus Yanofskybacteria bacterium RIFCSPHIGHO2_02_FULL_44_12b]|nr:MAG: hypothetical protein A3B99_02165 [Candidatus Yanofskybacteria bacterium RIFCSPHIGHO2_02_FULL_44_12b]
MIEVHKFLINPARLNRTDRGIGSISLGDVHQELSSLHRSGIIGSKNGFYFLSGRDGVYDVRIEREKITTAKWKKFLRLLKWFSGAPYLRGLFTSGSLALSNAHPESDFDVLVIAKTGRLYTCRLFLLLISSLLRSRRKRFDAVAPDKFCLNHYITDSDLRISHESLYNAQTYANLKPTMIARQLVHDFYKSNIWINKFVYNFKINDEFVRRSAPLNPILHGFARMVEFILNSRLGDILEIRAKKYQHERIKENPLTYEAGGRITFNESELEFHPRSFEKTIISKYNQGLRRLGIIPYLEEKDSGLIV